MSALWQVHGWHEEKLPEFVNGVRFVASAFARHEASLLHWWLWRLQLPLWYGGTVVDATRRCAMSTARSSLLDGSMK